MSDPVIATIADVEAVVGADTLRTIADHDGDGLRDDAVIQSALDDATSLALSFLEDQLPLPSPMPNSLRRAVVDIATSYLRGPRDAGTDDSRAAFDGAMKWLTRISEGKASLSAKPTYYGDPAVDPGDPESDGLGRVWSRSSARLVF